jgi:malonate transporter
MSIISIIMPLILVALLGFFCAKSQWLNRRQIDALSKFTFYLSIPAFLFYQMAQANFSEQISLTLFASFYLPVLCCYGIACLSHYFFIERKNPSSASGSAIFSLGASYSNTVIIGLPILLTLFGEQVLGIIFLIITFHSALLFTLTSAIASFSANGRKSFNGKEIIQQNLKNPLVVSISTGLVVNLLGIELPSVLANSLMLLGKPAIALALFILGASLAYYQVRDKLFSIGIASFSKLVLLPALVLLTSQVLFQLSPLSVTVLVILSACPTGVNAYLIAKAHQQEQQTVAGTVVVTTLLSMITIPLWLLLFT